MPVSYAQLQAVGLPVQTLPLAPSAFTSMITGTVDDLPGYFEQDVTETTIIPQGWDIHFDIIMEMRNRGYWEDVKIVFAATKDVIEEGNKFVEHYNAMVGQCFEDCASNGSVLDLKLKEGALPLWNEKMAKLKMEMVLLVKSFGELVLRLNTERRMKDCFRAHRNLRVAGNEKKWWDENLGLLLKQGDAWIEAPSTLEMWLEDLADGLEEKEGEIEEVRVSADTLCASYEEGQGMGSRTEVVYAVKNGVVSKKGKMTWVSVELGHVTGH